MDLIIGPLRSRKLYFFFKRLPYFATQRGCRQWPCNLGETDSAARFLHFLQLWRRLPAQLLPTLLLRVTAAV